MGVEWPLPGAKEGEREREREAMARWDEFSGG